MASLYELSKRYNLFTAASQEQYVRVLADFDFCLIKNPKGLSAEDLGKWSYIISLFSNVTEKEAMNILISEYGLKPYDCEEEEE